MRVLARNAYPVEAVRNEILLTTFIAGLSNPTVRWEVRKAKPADADTALQAAVETHSSLDIDGLKLQTFGINNISTETPLDTFTELVRSLRTEIQDAVAKSSRTDRNASQNNQRDRSDSQNSNRYRSLSTGPRRNNNFSNYKKPNPPNERYTARNGNNQSNNSEVRFLDSSKNNSRDRSSSSQRSDEEKC